MPGGGCRGDELNMIQNVIQEVDGGAHNNNNFFGFFKPAMGKI